MLAFAGCAVDAGVEATGEEDETLETAFFDGKADGIIDLAPPLALATAQTGFVGGDQIDLFAIDLRTGDQITLEQKVTSGNLSAGFTLFFGVHESIRSSSYSATTRAVTKHYTLRSSGRYIVAVKAYRGRGEGRYSLLATCTGGPCHGEPPPVVPLDVETKSACIKQARECAITMARATSPTRLSATRARSLFETCLDRGIVGDFACKPACEASTNDSLDAHPLCETVIGMVPFYATRSAECLGELTECYETCAGIGGNGSPEEMWTTTESICLYTGFNGTCNSYARSLTTCGGRTRPGTKAACHNLCEATSGAWTDDLDLLCVEACE